MKRGLTLVMDKTNNGGGRQLELDMAKGLGIILVVWVHARGPFCSYIEQFHMPFFFFISGMLYMNKNSSIIDYTKRKCKSLLIPFWCWNLVFFPVFFVLYYWKHWTFSEFACGLMEIILTVEKVPFLGATWFLASLFWISVLVHIVVTKFGKYRYCDLALLVMGSLLCVLGFYINLPFKQSRTLICSLFYISGHLYQKYIRGYIKDKMPNTVTDMIAIVFQVLFWVTASWNHVAMGSNIYEHKMLFIITAFMGILNMIWISGNIVVLFGSSFISKHIIYLGQNSIDIVIWQFLAFRVAIILQIPIMHASFKAITAFPVFDASGAWWVVYLVTGIYGSLLINYILTHNYFTPYLRKMHIVR